MQYYFYGKIEKDKLELENPERFKEIISLLKRNDGLPTKIEMSVLVYKRKRTSKKSYEKSNQNGYLFGVAIPILAEHFGYLPDEMFFALKNKFLRVGGTDSLPKVKSSSSLNTKEWEEWMEKIRIWALTDFNIIIPEPNENI